MAGPQGAPGQLLQVALQVRLDARPPVGAHAEQHARRAPGLHPAGAAVGAALVQRFGHELHRVAIQARHLAHRYHATVGRG